MSGESESLDLEAIRRRAMALTDGAGGAPYVRYREENEAGRWERGAHGPLAEGVRYAGCGVYVPDGPRLLCEVPPLDGQQRPEVAEAIANAGPDQLAMADEIGRLNDALAEAESIAVWQAAEIDELRADGDLLQNRLRGGRDDDHRDISPV